MDHTSSIEGPEAVRAALSPLLGLDLLAWEGLPRIGAKSLREAFGAPDADEETRLGGYRSKRLRYVMKAASGGFNAYVRKSEVILLETINSPGAAVLEILGEPCAIKPQEILAPDANAYVHEYVYCTRGLVLSVAMPFDKKEAVKILRCRGIRLLESPDEFGAELYMPLEDRTVW